MHHALNLGVLCVPRNGLDIVLGPTKATTLLAGWFPWFLWALLVESDSQAATRNATFQVIVDLGKPPVGGGPVAPGLGDDGC